MCICRHIAHANPLDFTCIPQDNHKQPPFGLRLRPLAPVVREKDMTLAAGRVALRKIRAELRGSAAAGADADADASGGSLVILASATKNALHLGELLLPVRVSFYLFFAFSPLFLFLLSCVQTAFLLLNFVFEMRANFLIICI